MVNLLLSIGIGMMGIIVALTMAYPSPDAYEIKWSAVALGVIFATVLVRRR